MKKMMGLGLAALSAALVLSGCNNTIFASDERDNEIVVEKDGQRSLRLF